MITSEQPIVHDLGQGDPILVVHGGMSDESPWRRTAETLADQHRVLLLRRRLYRPELPVHVDTSMADQVAEVVAVAETVGRPCLVVGHSSGALLALEAMVARPDLFVSGVCYEPPSPLAGLPLGRPSSVARTRRAVAAGRLGRALQIFLREAVQVSAPMGLLASAAAAVPEVRRHVARQIDDFAAIVGLGVRTDAYREIASPVWFLTGAKSPSHLRVRCARLTATLPHAELITLPGTGHGANQSHPRQLGELIGCLADQAFSR